MADDGEGRAREADQILALVKHDARHAFELVERQLAVLVLRTQVMLSLSGIVITVTGFSGRAIAETSRLARASITLGICVVLASAVVAIGGVLRLRWLTQALGPDVRATLVGLLAIRDRRARSLSIALALFAVGFSLYCLSIAQLLAAAHVSGP